ncbi:MAG: hypothetical protein BSK19_05020 [Stenotrophomonas maltophilia]|nr:MAG: hypothetical protein BSK19_05020 [Stenotrophomonas maltophilia]
MVTCHNEILRSSQERKQPYQDDDISRTGPTWALCEPLFPSMKDALCSIRDAGTSHILKRVGIVFEDDILKKRPKCIQS